MGTDLEYFSQQLKDRLQRGLPGEPTHRKMMARPHDRDRFDFQLSKNARKSSVLILLYPSDNHIHLPLIVRPRYDGAHSGQVAFPGGRMEKEDKDLTDTALRESEEEIGIKKQDIQVLGQLTELFIPVSNYLVTPIIGYTNFSQQFVREKREVDKILEVPLPSLLDDGIVKEKEMTVRGFRIRAPYYDINGETVWGATAMILSEFLDIVKDINEN